MNTALAMYRLTSRDLHIEITESTIIASPVVLATLVELRNLDFEVHVDDFGTGCSSLAYLHDLPVDTLEIDRSFVSSADSTGVRNTAIVKTIASLARRLSMQTTAEGVETREPYEALRSIGCTNAQG